MFGMHAAGGHLETLSGTEGNRVVVPRDSDFATQDQRLGVEVMAVIGRDQVRLHAAVHNPIAVATQVCIDSAVSIVSAPCLDIPFVRYGGHVVNFRGRNQPSHRPRR